ncbi:MBG domain-containing protein, partial [Pseudomonas sp. 21C1]|uniref:MBG domain-containing protein n=1 Tax=Pseudomonas sp. 21C1 TaxID=1843690 RepID=UPI002114C880
VTAISGDTVSLSDTGVGTFADKNAGGNKAVTVTGYTLSGNDADNYNIVQPTGLTATISKAALTVKANNASKTYDGLTFSGGNGVSYSDFVNGENASVLGGALVYGGTSQDAKNAGTYSLNASGLNADNYTISYTDGNLTIDKAQATVTANSGQVIYNGQQQSVSGFTASGLVNDETTSVLSGVSTSGGSGTNAGSYSHSASGSDDNYNLTFVDGSLTIDKAQATVTANSGQMVYNGQQQSIAGFTANGLVNGETTSVLSGVSTSGGSGTNAGSYSHSASGSDDNYNLTFVDGSLTIDKAQATVTANSGQMVYNGQQQSIAGFTASGLVNGETTSVLSGVSTSGGSGTNAGSYSHSASGSDENYDLTFVDGNLTINKAALTVTANNASKTYNGLAFSGG